MSTVIRFVTTATFQRSARKLFSEDDLAALRVKLAANPEAGDMIPGTGGARKMRHFGKRGASRVVYYLHLGRDVIFLLFGYAKGAQADLTPSDTQRVARMVQDIKKELRS